MPYRAELTSSMAENPQRILAIWREERSLRVANALCSVGVVFSIIATVADYFWSDIYVFATDLILLAGCALSLYWTRAKMRPRYFWMPLFIGFWISVLPSWNSTGGLNSPFFAVSVAALYIIGVSMDSQNHSLRYFFFAFFHLPALYLIEKIYPLSLAGAPPLELNLIVNGLTLGAIFVCVHAMLRTERELAQEFSEHYRSLMKAEENLKRSEGLLKEAQSIAHIGSWEWDIGADKISWSDELFKIFEVDKSTFDPSYKAYLGRQRPEVNERIHRIIQDSLRTGEDFIFENITKTSRGERSIFSRGRVVKDERGRIVKMLGTSQDITDRKVIESQLVDARLELEKRVQERTTQLAQSLEREKAAKKAAENADQAKMQFLANMSHEIRTPINSILGFSELIATRKPSPEQVDDYLERIQKNGRQLLHLINDILDLSKFEAGLIPIEKSPISLQLLVEDVVKSFMPIAKSKQIELSLTFKGDVSTYVYSDSHRLSQVLNNLLSNSVKFSEKGVVKIIVDAGGSPRDEKFNLAVHVEDQGIGILAENQRNLFQPFSQGDSSIARKFGGSGLGLALSKRIAQALGGSLKLVTSIPGQGSHFLFEVPLERVMPAMPRPPESVTEKIQEKETTSELNGKRILVVEDSPDNALLVRHYLESQGAVVEVATDGLLGFKAATEKEFDFILMDIQMPGMDGLEATRRIRRHGYKKPIIALTAHALAAEASKSIEAGCDLHLTKPISKQKLIDSLVELLPKPV